RLHKLGLIRQLRLLQLPPLLLGCPLFKLGLERQQPVTDGRILLDIDFPLRRVDKPKVLALHTPALDVLAAQKRLEQLRRLRILRDKPVARVAADDEGLVQPSLDAVKRRAVDLAQRFAARHYLVAQTRQRVVLEAPGAAAET